MLEDYSSLHNMYLGENIEVFYLKSTTVTLLSFTHKLKVIKF